MENVYSGFKQPKPNRKVVKRYYKDTEEDAVKYGKVL